MTYREAFRRRIKVSSLTLADWAVLSFAVAIAAAGAVMLFQLVAILVGSPGPFVIAGDQGIFSNLALAGGGTALAILCFNLLGAATLRIVFHIAKMLRRRDPT